MKVFLRYEDNVDTSLHKTLKITLPKKWKTGPTSRLLEQFVESYNGGKEGELNPLEVDSLHLSAKRPGEQRSGNSLTDLPSDGIVVDVIPDREDVYICHGPSRKCADFAAEKAEERAKIEKEKEAKKNLASCVRFGCNKRFPKGGPYPECNYHLSPPVFHETAKWWSCCPDKKAYDWDQFQTLPTCQTGRCTDVRDDDAVGKKQFLGGCDLRERNGGGADLRSIDDFNANAAAGGSEGAPVLERLRSVLAEVGVENELFDQVLEGIKNDASKQVGPAANDAVVVDEAARVLGGKLKNAMKSIAVEQLRIR